jgi:hypothetical protein
MARNRLPKSIRKYLRTAKAEIRLQAVDREEAWRKVSTLVADTRGRYANRGA